MKKRLYRGPTPDSSAISPPSPPVFDQSNIIPSDTTAFCPCNLIKKLKRLGLVYTIKVLCLTCERMLLRVICVFIYVKYHCIYTTARHRSPKCLKTHDHNLCPKRVRISYAYPGRLYGRSSVPNFLRKEIPEFLKPILPRTSSREFLWT